VPLENIIGVIKIFAKYWITVLTGVVCEGEEAYYKIVKGTWENHK
jgi:hypothetical protein